MNSALQWVFYWQLLLSPASGNIAAYLSMMKRVQWSILFTRHSARYRDKKSHWRILKVWTNFLAKYLAFSIFYDSSIHGPIKSHRHILLLFSFFVRPSTDPIKYIPTDPIENIRQKYDTFPIKSLCFYFVFAFLGGLFFSNY